MGLGEFARDVTDKEWEVLAVVYENIEGLRQLLASNLGVTLPRDVQARLGRTLVGLQDERRILGAEPVPVQLPE